MAWFKNWFGTHYYSLLYSHRDYDEAEDFIDTLTDYLKIKKGAKVLDAGCGRGRHAIHLADNGLNVFGVDISAESIEIARKSEHQHLHFFNHDMREPLPEKNFDVIFNLFTSFGYFEDEKDDARILKSWCDALKPGGILVIDFLNPEKVGQNLVAEETIIKENVQYFIKRKIKNHFVIKDIRVVDESGTYDFQEKVKLIYLKDFQKFMNEACFNLKQIFGNYKLEPFNDKTSDRLILIAEKQ